MTDILAGQTRTLEDMFFAKKEAVLLEKKKELARLEHTKKVLSELSGIKNEAILQKLVEFDVSPETITSLALIPLVEVAWADGDVAEEEKKAVLAAASESKIAEGNLNRDLLSQWLTKRPPRKMLDAWIHYISGLCEFLTKEERDILKTDLLKRARTVAEAAGGFLGMMKISSEEQAVLDKLDKAFDVHS